MVDSPPYLVVNNIPGIICPTVSTVISRTSYFRENSQAIVVYVGLARCTLIS